MNAMKPYWMLAKREVWEHKSLWIVQLVLLGIGIFGALWGSAALIISAQHGLFSLPDIQNHVSVGNRALLIHGLIISGAIGADIFMLFVVCFYLMDCLYGDRRDRSVLFWRSMPVSDTATVLSKLFTGMVTAPVIMLAQVIVAEIVIGIIFVIAFAFLGVNLLGILFAPGTIITAWITLAFGLWVQSLWFLPYFGWFLLCSAWAKKLPLGWTVLVPLGAMLLEGIVFRTHYLFNAIFGHMDRWFGALGVRESFRGMGVGVVVPNQPLSHTGWLMTVGSVADYLLRSEMWIGVAIGIIFVLGAIWLRRNHSEI